VSDHCRESKHCFLFLFLFIIIIIVQCGKPSTRLNILHPVVLQGTGSQWIWVEYMHPNGSEDCREQNGLTLNEQYICFGLYFQVPYLNFTSNYHLEI